MTSADHTLAHSLQPRHVTMISLGGIIGAGIFVGSSAAIHIAGPSVLFTYALCGLLVFVIMRMLGEMAISRPGVGTFTGYTKLGLGPWAGFVVGWLYFYFWVVTIAVEAIAGANMLTAIIPAPPWVLSSALIVVTTLINMMSVRAYAGAGLYLRLWAGRGADGQRIPRPWRFCTARLGHGVYRDPGGDFLDDGQRGGDHRGG